MERERTFTPVTPRPAVRAFATRELLLSSWSDRLKLSPAEQTRFSYDQWLLEMSLRRKGVSLAAAASQEVALNGELASTVRPSAPRPASPS